MNTSFDELRARLETDVRYLADTIGPRHYQRLEALHAARDYIRQRLDEVGVEVHIHQFMAKEMSFENLEVVIPAHGADAGGAASAPPCIVVGGHYDTVHTTPGADDNATAVAALLEFARQLHERRFSRPIRLCFFPNEEMPFYPLSGMGSDAYAKLLKQARTKVHVMLSLEMLGYYSDAPGSQSYPPGLSRFFTDRGNFIGFVGNLMSRRRINEFKSVFQQVSDFPCESLAAPAVTLFVGLSDQLSFWRAGYRAFMVTDTAFMRNPNYHQPTDTPDTLDFERYARVTQGVIDTVARLADS